jgi:hypothetical protein
MLATDDHRERPKKEDKEGERGKGENVEHRMMNEGLPLRHASCDTSPKQGRSTCDLMGGVGRIMGRMGQMGLMCWGDRCVTPKSCNRTTNNEQRSFLCVLSVSARKIILVACLFVYSRRHPLEVRSNTKRPLMSVFLLKTAFLLFLSIIFCFER